MKILKVFVIALFILFLTSCDEVADDGVNSITSAVVNSEGHLVLTYEDGTVVDQGLVIPEEDIVEYHLVNFYNPEGHIISTQMIEDGEDAFAPSLDLPSTMTFVEWDTEFTNVTMALNIHPVYEMNELSITFHNEEVTVPDMTGIMYGEAITLPLPEVDGKQFIGWAIDDSPYAPLISMYTVVENNLELYARYEDITYTVTYHTMGGTEVMIQEALYGDLLAIPETPHKDDYFFNGWYYDTEEMMPVEFDVMLTEDIDIYASWIQFEYTFYDNPSYANDEYIGITSVIGEHNNIHIPSMIDGYPVERIKYGAFIDEEYYEVHLPDTLKIIEDYAFKNMHNLTSIVLPSQVTYIGYEAFYNCTSLRDVTLSDELNYVSNNSFTYTAIESIVIPDTVTEIGYSAFANTPLSSVTLPSSLVYIYNYAFENTNLTEVVIPEGTRYIYYRAFAGCENLTTISLPESLSYIAGDVFNDDPNLTSVTLHENNTNLEIVDDVIYSEGMNALYVYLPYKTDTTFVIPETVIELMNRSFTGNPYLETLSLPDTLNQPRAYNNFFNMISLSSFTVYDAPGTAMITAENGVLYTADYTYLYKYPMMKTDTAFAVNSATLRIDDRSFEDNEFIASVVLGSNIQRIEYYAFEDCINLTAVNFPATLTHIYDGAFYNVDGITNIVLPNTVTFIGSEAFAEMDNLTSFTLSTGETGIPSYLFRNSNNLTSFHIHAGVTYISSNAFAYAKGLTTITIDGGNTTYNVYNNSVYSEDFTTLYAVPGGHTSDSYYVHYLAQRIYAHFGDNPNIEIIRTGSSCIQFSAYVQDLPNLQGIVFQNTSAITSLGSYPFDPFYDEGFTLYVRQDLYDDYLEDYSWQYFHDWIQPY